MRCACIDVGSNTTRLLVAEDSPAGPEPLLNERSFTLIGESLAGADTIPREKVDETAGVVAEQAERARAAGAIRIRVVATAAIRRAANAAELVAAVQARSGLALEVLPGEEEARLAFAGATQALGAGGGRLAVIDVGGGSTEIAIGEGGCVTHAQSLPVGSSLLTERHLLSDPPSEDELQAAAGDVARILETLELPAVERAVAVGGSASSLEHLAGPELGPSELAVALGLLRATASAELAVRYGLAPPRMRLLPAGLLVLAGLSKRLGTSLQICKSGLREGVIREMIGSPD